MQNILNVLTLIATTKVTDQTSWPRSRDSQVQLFRESESLGVEEWAEELRDVLGLQAVWSLKQHKQ